MADDADTHEKDVEELDERMQKLTHKLENARRDFVRSAASDAYDYEKAQRVLDKIDAHQHEKELKVQEKLKASERKLEKAKKAGNAEDEEKYIVNFMYHKIMVVDMEAFPGAPSENEE